MNRHYAHQETNNTTHDIQETRIKQKKETQGITLIKKQTTKHTTYKKHKLSKRKNTHTTIIQLMILATLMPLMQ